MKVVDIIDDILCDRELPDCINYKKTIYNDIVNYRVHADNSTECIFMFRMISENPMVVYTSFSYINYERNSSHNLVVSADYLTPTVFKIDDDLSANLFQYYLINTISDRQILSLDRLIGIYHSLEKSRIHALQIVLDTSIILKYNLE